MACSESVDTGRQRESSNSVYLVVSILENYYFVSKRKKKTWKVINFIIGDLFNIDRSMKWKAQVK